MRRNQRFEERQQSAREDIAYAAMQGCLWSTVVASKVKYTTSWQPPGGGSRRWCMGWGVWGGRGAQAGRKSVKTQSIELHCTAPSHLLDMLFVARIERVCQQQW